MLGRNPHASPLRAWRLSHCNPQPPHAPSTEADASMTPVELLSRQRPNSRSHARTSHQLGFLFKSSNLGVAVKRARPLRPQLMVWENRNPRIHTPQRHTRHAGCPNPATVKRHSGKMLRSAPPHQTLKYLANGRTSRCHAFATARSLQRV